MSDSTRRLIEVAMRLRRDGTRDAAKRLVRRAAERVGANVPELPLHAADVVDSTMLDLPVPATHLDIGQKGTIGWVCTPPGPGSGGHTTLFRMVEGLESRGHSCVLFLHDRHGGDFERHRAVIRRHWPAMKAEIRDAAAGIDGVDACVATSWSSAHVLASRGRTPMRRLYFIQDYEPFFYPRGSLYSLAKDTYRFGFRCISLGGMVSQQLESELGVKADIVPFGCDTATYRRTVGGPPRTGVVFFARPSVPRRGFTMGMLALEQFHRRHPEQEIHVYGEHIAEAPFPITSHGSITPAALNDLYNRTIAGLALSFTNVTLVSEEMLASGNIPIANDTPLARAGLDNDQVVWASATPTALADALSEAVEATDIDERSTRASESVRDGWSVTQDGVIALIEGELHGTH